MIIAQTWHLAELSTLGYILSEMGTFLGEILIKCTLPYQIGEMLGKLQARYRKF